MGEKLQEIKDRYHLAWQAGITGHHPTMKDVLKAKERLDKVGAELNAYKAKE